MQESCEFVVLEECEYLCQKGQDEKPILQQAANSTIVKAEVKVFVYFISQLIGS